jgi:hypothetical protein
MPYVVDRNDTNGSSSLTQSLSLSLLISLPGEGRRRRPPERRAPGRRRVPVNHLRTALRRVFYPPPAKGVRLTAADADRRHNCTSSASRVNVKAGQRWAYLDFGTK